MRYETVADAYRDLEQASGRLALTERLAALLAAAPAGLLPVVCYLCQGLIAPEFAGVDLGLAESSPSARSPPPLALGPGRPPPVCGRPATWEWRPSNCWP